MKKLLAIFWECFKISLFVIGGGYLIIVVADQVFSRKKWIREGELVEHLPVFQMVPGLIATHTAVYVGNRMAGPLGSLVGVVAMALPSIAIFTLVSIWYREIPLDNPWLNSAFVGLRAALTGIIAATIVKSWKRFMTDAFAYALLVAGVVALALVGVPVWAVLVASMACGLIAVSHGPRATTFHAVAWLPLLYFLQYGALCFGGGFVLVPMYLADFVGPTAPYLQLSPEEFSNIMAVSQMTPGPIGVNCATFFGYRLAGLGGATLASILLLLPGSLIAWCVFQSLEKFRASPIVRGILRGVRPASIALMLVALVAFARLSVFDTEGGFHLIGAILVLLTMLITMKKKLNVILLIILCAGLACALRADEAHICSEPILRAPSYGSEQICAARFPDADSVVVDEIERVAYKPDGTSTTLCESWTKILTERGRRQEGIVRLGYNKRYGAAKIVYVGAIGTNGVERAIDVSGTTNDTTDNSSLASNIVDPLDRVIVCTIPGLAIGETVHLKTEQATTQSRVKDQWSDVCFFEWTRPILKSVYEVRAPKARPILSRAVLHPLGNVTEEVKPLPDGTTLYVYTATNSPQAFPEPDMPPLWTQVQSVHLSTARSWQDISRWYWDLCLPHLAKTTPEMTNLVERLGRDMSRIFTFVSQEVRYMGLTMEDISPGYAPHDVNITFDNRYGVCRDKAGLLVALLRIAGYKAFPVLINAGAKMDAEVPKPYFNHAIVAVEEKVKVKGEGEKIAYRLMDPTNENTKDLFPGYLCNCSYIVARPEGETLKTSPVPRPEGNAVNATTRGTLRDDGTMAVESDLAFSGINDTLYRGSLAKMTPEQRVKFFERLVKSLQPGSELIRCDIVPKNVRDTSVPLHVSLLATMPETVLRGESADTLSVPFVTRVCSIANWLLENNMSLEKRRYPLVLDTTAQARETVEIDLGTALGAPKSLPEANIAAAEKDRFAFVRSFAVSNGTLRAERVHTIGAVEFSPDEYAQMREDIKRIEATERRSPVFAADVLKNANTRTLLESTDVDIASDTAWTETNTYVREVLTYRGKRDSAEVKLALHPAWRHVKVLSATVSNLNGVVSRVKPVEMNEMDAPWAAAAPRYPAGKTLIVNLPAVEIGSVIAMTTVTTVTNAPAPYYGVFGFDAKSPLERCHVRVDDWARDVVAPKRIPDEPGQPESWRWRDTRTFSKCSFAKAADALRLAADVEPISPNLLSYACCLSASLQQGATTSVQQQEMRLIRDWMARNVRIAGPGLYEVPITQQLTHPLVVIAERYATRLDYIRTLCALLKGADYDADIVFAARNAGASDAARRRDIYDYPNVRAFASAVCRVRVKEGGFLGFGGETRTYYLGTENEYTPIETTAFEGCDFFDPEDEAFGVIQPLSPAYASFALSRTLVTVRPNGAVDYDADSSLWGADVGNFRKRYAEILPEDFSRHYQAILGGVAKAASATRELKPDIAGYPASLTFSCFVPDYATIDGDTLTLKLPPFECPFPALPGSVRQTPIALGDERPAEETVIVRLPEGYDALEAKPDDFAFVDPHGSDVWLSQTTTVTNYVADSGARPLELRITRKVAKHDAAVFGAEYAELVADWRRRATALASRTIVVRRKQP